MIFQSIDFLKILLQSDNGLLVSEMQKQLGGNRLRFRDKNVWRTTLSSKNWRT